MLAAAPAVSLEDNSGVLYRGRELVHYRHPRGGAGISAAAEEEGGGGEEGCGLHQLVFAWRTVHDLHCVGE